MHFLNQIRFCSTISHPSLKIQSSVVTPSNFVPKHEKARKEDIDKLNEFLHHDSDQEGGLLVMTGAGISTESGLPDYRSEGVGLYARSTRRPLQVLNVEH